MTHTRLPQTRRGTTAWVWVLAALGAHTGWGANPVLLRYLQTVSLIPSMSLYLVGSTVVLVMLAIIVLPRFSLRVFRSRILLVVAVVVVLRVLTNLLATRFTQAMYVQLINMMTPFFVALLSIMVFRERLPPFTGRAALLSLLGAVLMMSQKIDRAGIGLELAPSDRLGIGLAIASTVFLAVYMIIVRRTVQQHMPAGMILFVQLAAVVFVTGTLSALLGEDWGRWGVLSVTDWLVFATLIFGVLMGANLAQIGALQHLGAPLMSTLLAWRLVSALVFGGLLLDERLTSPWQVAGALIVLVTITWYLWQQRTGHNHPLDTVA